MQIDRPITIAAILLIVLAFVVFLIVPEYKSFRQLRADLGEKIAERTAKVEYYSAVDKVYEDLQSRKDDVKKIDNALPKDSELGRLIYYLEKTATKSGIILKSLSLSRTTRAQSTEGAGLKTITFTAELLGNYSSLARFMLNLEESARLFEVTSISFGSVTETPTSSESEQSKVKVQFQSNQTYNFSLQIETHSY